MQRSAVFLFGILCLSLFAETRGSLRIETEKFGNEDTSSILVIQTDIPRTEVYLNGKRQGTTPYRTNQITPGYWRIGLKNKGYHPESFLVRVEPGEQKKVYVELLPLSVTPRPETQGAEPGNEPVTD